MKPHTITLCVLFCLCRLFSQTAAPAFEVASIKPVPPEAQCGMIQALPGGGLNVECMDLRTLLTWAYQVRRYQISGGAPWVDSMRWTILAKPGRDGGPEDFDKLNDSERNQAMDLVRQRLQALLADRFHLEIQRESKEQTAYTLVVGKSGLKMQEAKPDAPGFLKMGRGQLIGNGAQMATLVSYLGDILQRPVVDRTGLAGHYEFKIEWTPDPPASANSPESEPAARTGPTLFTAIQEQTGLRLTAEKTPVETIVIRRVEKPSEN
jgi:uncharacterized protein (TIGR03435 family)